MYGSKLMPNQSVQDYVSICSQSVTYDQGPQAYRSIDVFKLLTFDLKNTFILQDQLIGNVITRSLAFFTSPLPPSRCY